MFPSAHDITPANVDAYIRVANVLLNKGNLLLIVSKPHLSCVAKMCDAFHSFSSQILFRFTIGTMDEAVAKHWEPGAPLPSERVAALRLAYESGYKTSVSAEPLLGGLETARELIASVRDQVSESIWVGKMNKIRARVDMSVETNQCAVVAIEAAQTDTEILRLVDALHDDPLIRWKDSVLEVLERTSKQEKR